MKKLLLLFILIGQISFAQNSVFFNINHILNGTENFDTDTKGKNNLDNLFTLTRMEYYISEIKVTHDGGQVTEMTDTYILVDGFSSLSFDLGMHNINTLENVKFSIGVDSAHNHLDPSTYPIDHPLAPKSPSMHWGWSSGYRFIAMEGIGYGNVFELHATSDALYKEVSLDYSETTAENNNLIIDIDANYEWALKDLDVLTGFNVHGTENNPEVVQTVNNFQIDVFSAKEGDDAVSITEQKDYLFNAYPNPTTGVIYFNDISFDKISIINSLGKTIPTFYENSNTIKLESKGLYFINFYKDGFKETKKIFVL